MQAPQAIQTGSGGRAAWLSDDMPDEQADWEFRLAGEVDPVLMVNSRWLSRCRGVRVRGGKGLPLEQRIPVVDLISALFMRPLSRYVPGRRVDRQRMILTG
jgi:hypothetical protein